jgi:hypothetical protein
MVGEAVLYEALLLLALAGQLQINLSQRGA